VLSADERAPQAWIAAGFRDTGLSGEWRDNDLHRKPFKFLARSFAAGQRVHIDPATLDYVVLLKEHSAQAGAPAFAAATGAHRRRLARDTGSQLRQRSESGVSVSETLAGMADWAQRRASDENSSSPATNRRPTHASVRGGGPAPPLRNSTLSRGVSQGRAGIPAKTSAWW
jgi:hypothetical protein